MDVVGVMAAYLPVVCVCVCVCVWVCVCVCCVGVYVCVCVVHSLDRHCLPMHRQCLSRLSSTHTHTHIHTRTTGKYAAITPTTSMSTDTIEPLLQFYPRTV